jgi:Uma2 family endonuclease
MTVLMDRPSATDEHGSPEPEELLDSLELPPGYKAELVGREIIVTPPPELDHQTVLRRVRRQLPPHGWEEEHNIGVITPGGKFIPDLVVADLDYLERESRASWQPPEGIAMVVEVTSSNASTDRDEKRRGYAAAKIPLFLLVDRQQKETVLFSKPEGGDYTLADRRPIDEQIPLPEPFSFTLESPHGRS